MFIRDTIFIGFMQLKPNTVNKIFKLNRLV